MPPAAAADGYRSEIGDSRAKAWFAFSRFRLLGSENRWDEAIEALRRAIDFDPDTDYLRIILAKAYLHTGQPELTIAALEELLQYSARNIAALELLGDVYGYQQQDRDAIRVFRRALELDPERETLHLRLALVLARQGQTAEAIDILEQVLERHPEAVNARLSLARLYRENELPAAAAAAYRQVLERHPALQQAVLEYGKLLEEGGDTSVEELYRTALEKDTEAVSIRQRLAQYYLAQHELEQALEQYEVIRRQFPENLQIIGRIALIQLELERWSAAEDNFRRLLEIPEHADQNRYYLAMALSGQDKYNAAIETLETISAESTLYPDVVLQLAYLHNRAGRKEAAIAILNEALSAGLEGADIHYYLTAFLADRNNYAAARDIALVGTGRHPRDTRLLYQLAIIREKLGQRQAAVSVMEKILSIDPEHADALNFLAYHQAELGERLDQALERAEKALAIEHSGYIVDTIGWIYFKMGRYPESRRYLEEAIRLHPEDAVIREHLGDLYAAMGLYQQAADCYRRVLALDTAAKHVAEKLKNLPGQVVP